MTIKATGTENFRFVNHEQINVQVRELHALVGRIKHHSCGSSLGQNAFFAGVGALISSLPSLQMSPVPIWSLVACWVGLTLTVLGGIFWLFSGREAGRWKLDIESDVTGITTGSYPVDEKE